MAPRRWLCYALPLFFVLQWSSTPAQDCAETGGCEHEESSLLALRPQRQVSSKAGSEGRPDEADWWATSESSLRESARRCGAARGIFWSLGSEKGHAKSLAGWRPLKVPAGATLKLLLCRVGNRAFSGNGTIAEVLPTLVAEVGWGAEVTVSVVESFNVELEGSLVLEAAASLMPVIIQGNVTGSRVAVFLSDSGNVQASGDARLEVLDGSLVAPVLSGNLEHGLLRLLLEDSGNVRGGGSVSLKASGALLATLVKAESVELASVKMSVKASGNVKAARLQIQEGRLLWPLLELAEASHGDLAVSFADLGRVRVGELSLESGSLAPVLVKVAGALERTGLSADLEDVASVQVQDMQLRDSELLGMVLDLFNVSSSQVSLEVHGCANAKAGNATLTSSRAVTELLGYALYARKTVQGSSQVRIAMKSVASMEAQGTVDLRSSQVAGYLCYLRGSMVSGMLSVKVEEVGSVKAEVLRTTDRARLAWYAVYGPRATLTNLSLAVSVARSFNLDVSEDLNLQANDWLKGILGAHMEGCSFSTSVRDSMNFRVGGNMALASISAQLAFYVHYGDLLSSTGSTHLERSLNARVLGDLHINTFGEFVYTIHQGDRLDSTYKLAVSSSVNVDVQGALTMPTFARLIYEVLEGHSRNSSTIITLANSANAHARTSATLGGFSSLMERVVDGETSGGGLELQLSQSARLRSPQVHFDSGMLAERFVRARKGSLAHVKISAQDVANIHGRKVVMEGRYSRLLTNAFEDECNDSVVHVELENVANVEAESFSRSGGEMLYRVVRMDGSVQGLAMEVKARNVANVRAESIDVNNSYGVFMGYHMDICRGGCTGEHTLVDSSLILRYEEVGRLLGKRVSLQSSTLLGPLFNFPQVRGSRLAASLEHSARVEASRAASLRNSSLLGNVLSPATGNVSLKDLHLDLEAMGVICSQQGDKELTLGENASLCLDGAKALRAVADGFERSCRTGSCKLLD